MLLATFFIAFAFLFLPGTFDMESSAQTVFTTEYDGDNGYPGDWEWTTDGGGRFSWAYRKLVNRKTKATLSAGWHVVDDCWFYFEKGGYVFDEMHDGYYIGGAPDGLYYIDGEVIRYTWKKDSHGWRYKTDYDFGEEDPGYLYDSYYRIDGKVYWFDIDGYLYPSGWQYIDENYCWIFVEKGGACATGWKKIQNKWYFFDYFSGIMADRSVDTSPIGKDGETYSAFDENGVWIQGNGWKETLDGYVFMQKNKCVTGWRKIQGKWYYFNPHYDAVMAQSWISWDDPSEHCYCYIDGYYIDENGVCGKGGYGWHETSKGIWFGKGSYYEKSTEAMIDNNYCLFNAKGYLIYRYDYTTGEEWGTYPE